MNETKNHWKPKHHRSQHPNINDNTSKKNIVNKKNPDWEKDYIKFLHESWQEKSQGRNWKGKNIILKMP